VHAKVATLGLNPFHAEHPGDRDRRQDLRCTGKLLHQGLDLNHRATIAQTTGGAESASEIAELIFNKSMAKIESDPAVHRGGGC